MKAQIQKDAVDYLADYCNGKIKFEDAMVQFATQHVVAAIDIVAKSATIIIPGNDTKPVVGINMSAYPLTNIK